VQDEERAKDVAALRAEIDGLKKEDSSEKFVGKLGLRQLAK